MTTSEVLISMLTENTGRHMLDSGGAYGRHYERNQTRDFASEPDGTLRFEWYDETQWECMAQLSTYHFLNRVLSMPQKRYQLLWDKYVKLSDEDEHWFSLMQTFPGFCNLYIDMCYDTDTVEPASVLFKSYNPDNSHTEFNTVNTYNHESLLDQVIQYTMWETPYGDTLALLQVHGGCDVRGGYSAPKLFETEEYALYDDRCAVIFPDNHEEYNGTRVNWSTDDAYHWYFDGCCGIDWKQLETYDASKNPDDRGKGVIYIDEDGNGYCPLTGGKLLLSQY